VNVLAGPTIHELLEYTDWERRNWFEWMRHQDRPVLEIPAGPSIDGRFEKVGDLIRHIFSGEKRYVDRLSDRPITDTSTISATDLEALDRFGRQSRGELRDYIDGLAAGNAETPVEFKMMNSTLTATPRKIVTHILMHEIRHWAQIATLLRLNGLKVGFHDFLFSPVMGGELRRESQNA